MAKPLTCVQGHAFQTHSLQIILLGPFTCELNVVHGSLKIESLQKYLSINNIIMTFNNKNYSFFFFSGKKNRKEKTQTFNNFPCFIKSKIQSFSKTQTPKNPNILTKVSLSVPFLLSSLTSQNPKKILSANQFTLLQNPINPIN